MNWVASHALEPGAPVPGAKYIVGSRLAQLLRLRPDLNQARLAEMLGVERSAVSMWIKGKNLPSAKYLDQLAGIFGVKVHELFMEDDQEQPADRPREATPEEGLRVVAKAMGFILKRRGKPQH